MSCNFYPLPHLLETRRTIQQLVRPGRVMTDQTVAAVIASLNTAIEITREYQDEMMVIESLMLPMPLPVVSVPAERPRPRLTVIDGGAA